MKHRLCETLTQAGQQPREYCNPDGSSVLILPHGGRLLGLFPPGSDENFYWTHAALESAESASQFYAGPQWHNSGGERTWLAPEVDFFFPDFPKLDRYWQPRQLDPGQWELSFEQGRPRLVNRLSCTLARSKAEVDLEISKSIAPAPIRSAAQAMAPPAARPTMPATSKRRRSECWPSAAGSRPRGLVEPDPDAARRRAARAHLPPDRAAHHLRPRARRGALRQRPLVPLADVLRGAKGRSRSARSASAGALDTAGRGATDAGTWWFATSW